MTDKKPREVQLVDPSSGDLVTSISLDPFGSVTSDGAGGFIAPSTTTRFFTAAGKERGQLAQATSGPFHHGDGFFAFRNKDGGLFVDAKTLEILGCFKGVVSKAEMDSRAPGGTLLLHGFPQDHDKPGEAVLLRLALQP